LARPSGSPHELVARKARLRLIGPQDGAAMPPVLELSGEFDLDTVPDIDRFLRRHLGPLYHQDHLVIDLAATTFVDSSFIAFVVRLLTDQRARRKELVLVRPVGQVRRVLALVGLPNVVPVFESVDEAVSTLVSGRLPVIPPAFSPAPV
jgi:stage II sporulation protein AA (anti-sigma F factor antagonist)